MEDSYLEDYSDPSTQQSPHTISRGYMALSSSVIPNQLLDVWIADSGANQHMSHKLELFTHYKPLSNAKSWPITSIDGNKTYVAGTGTVRFLIQLPDRTESFSLENVLYVPGLGCNLFSTTAIAKKHGLIFTGGADRCTFTKDNELFLTGRLTHDMYVLDITVLLPQTFAQHANSFGNIPNSQERQSIQTWHHRFGHLNYEMIKHMERRGSVIGLQLSKREPDHLCVGCQFGTHQRAPFPVNSVRQRFPKPGDLIHADICGPMSVPSYGGSVYFVLFKDDATSFRFVFCISRKSEALACFKKVCLQITKDTGHTVQMLRTDRGGEFANKAFDQFLAAHSIRREYTTPYTPEQNSVAEREFALSWREFEAVFTMPALISNSGQKQFNMWSTLLIVQVLAYFQIIHPSKHTLEYLRLFLICDPLDVRHSFIYLLHCEES